MDRLTRRMESEDRYMVDEAALCRTANGYAGNAVEKLAKFENAYGDLLDKQQKTIQQMQSLKAQGKIKSARYKQLLAEKLTNSYIIIWFESYGL